MKISELYNILNESKNEDETPNDAPPPSGSLISTAQAAKILGVSMSRIRQYKQDGVLTPESGPEPGSRDKWWKMKDIQSLKDKQEDGELPRTGRPPESKEHKSKKDE